MPSRKTSVLVVDDDVRILRVMQHILELEGYRVLRASSGEAAIDVFDGEAPAPGLVLLDIMLPGMDGITVCQRIREFSEVPIIMVSAKSKDEEKVQGFKSGADDYVTKPFSSNELVERVKAVLRRTELWDEHPDPAFCFKDLVVDFTQRRVSMGNREVNLTATEYGVLSYLARNAGHVVTPDQILVKIWGEEYLGESHLLQVFLGRIRRKLGDDTRNPRYILTKHGIGYMMMNEYMTK